MAAMALGATTVPAAAVSPPVVKVGPKQYFAGLVNGTTGPAIIRMACFGPVHPGQKGHAMAGQTLQVNYLGKVRPPTTAGDVGFTGPAGSEIGVFFGPLPPGAAPTGPVISTVYRVRQAIPTSVLLPCYGSGSVPFIPIPVVGGSHDAVAPVTFVGQP